MQTVRSRIDWALREGVVIAAVLAFWAVVFAGLALVLSVVLAVLQLLVDVGFPAGPVRFLFEFLSRLERLSAPAVVQLATANVGLYVLVRVGWVLLDRYAERVA